MRLRTPPSRGSEQGTITPLAAALIALLLLVTMAGIDVTAVQLARIDLMDAADAAAADAADELDEGTVYDGGLGEDLPLSSARVLDVASGSLAAQERPGRLASWSVASAGTPDGRTAEVALNGTAVLPIGGGLLESIGASVPLRAESRARSRVG